MKISQRFEEVRPKRPTSVALGLFDGLHLGHQQVLQSALGDRSLAPGVFTYKIDRELPERKRDIRFIMTLHSKWRLLEQMGFEYVVCPAFETFKSLSPEEFVVEMLIEKMNVREISCGKDFAFGRGASGNVEELIRLAQPRGVRVNVVEPVELAGERISSSRVRQAIQAGEMERVRQMLGRRFSIRFMVEHGNQIGRTIQFPTINQVFPRHHIVPRYGVYSTVIRVGDRLYSGVTNVGVKPTVGSYNPLAETFILDFSGNLYDRELDLYFFDFVRPETKFASIQALREQIARDTLAVRRVSRRNLETLARELREDPFESQSVLLPF